MNRTLRSEAAHFNSDVCAESLGFQLRGLSPRSRLNKHKQRFAQAPGFSANMLWLLDRSAKRRIAIVTAGYCMPAS